MTQKELDDCKTVIFNKLTYLKDKATKAQISTPKLKALEKQVTDAIDEFTINYNKKVDLQKINPS